MFKMVSLSRSRLKMGVTLAEGCETVQARPDSDKEQVLDPKGYFLIRLKRETKEIEVGFCRKGNVVEMILVGKSPKEIYDTILRRGLVSRLGHAAYLGRELEKAYMALKLNIDYVQDSELGL